MRICLCITINSKLLYKIYIEYYVYILNMFKYLTKTKDEYYTILGSKYNII